MDYLKHETLLTELNTEELQKIKGGCNSSIEEKPAPDGGTYSVLTDCEGVLVWYNPPEKGELGSLKVN
ncbi:bacteriocin [Pleurocapsa sp. PCC 7319]|uniref:bacteriocin n=1 Tax=Pleurocapsa sp. PCC 7319 TaxID=118161 RepID=UPI00034BC1C0|nr:bacteriocin [Pleurocapsa sp. PCC 7319]